MRVSFVPLVVLIFAGCNNGGGLSKTDAGTGGVGPITNPTDLAMSQPVGDMAMAPQGSTCYQIIQCVNKAGNDSAAQINCVAAGTTNARKEFTAILSCAQTQCGKAGADAGTGPCDTADQCQACVGTGTSPTGQTLGGQPCVNMQGGSPVDDPKCGKCVDQLLACITDS